MARSHSPGLNPSRNRRSPFPLDLRKPEAKSRQAGASRRSIRSLSRAGKQFGGLPFEFQPRILVRLGPGQRGDPLDEIED
jgi:hypothetical protein